MRAWSLSSASLLLAACSSLEPVRGEYVELTPLAHWTPEHAEFTCERLDWIYECMAADLDLEIPLPLTVVFEDREIAAHGGHTVHGSTTRLEDGELEIRLSAAVYDSWGGFEATVAHELTHAFLWRFELPFLLSFERDRELSECSLLLGLVRWRRTPVAWDLRLLWVAAKHRYALLARRKAVPRRCARLAPALRPRLAAPAV